MSNEQALREYEADVDRHSRRYNEMLQHYTQDLQDCIRLIEKNKFKDWNPLLEVLSEYKPSVKNDYNLDEEDFYQTAWRELSSPSVNFEFVKFMVGEWA